MPWLGRHKKIDLRHSRRLLEHKSPHKIDFFVYLARAFNIYTWLSRITHGMKWVPTMLSRTQAVTNNKDTNRYDASSFRVRSLVRYVRRSLFCTRRKITPAYSIPCGITDEIDITIPANPISATQHIVKKPHI